MAQQGPSPGHHPALVAFLLSASVLPLLLPAASSQALPCPAVGAPPASARLDTSSFFEVAKYFSDGVFSVYRSSSLQRCKTRALEDACSSGNTNKTAFVLFANDTFVNDPVSFEPGNCVAGPGCVENTLFSRSPPFNATSAVLLAIRCKGCFGLFNGTTVPVKRHLQFRNARCPRKGGFRMRRPWCPGSHEWACACTKGPGAEVRDKKGVLLKCK